MQLPSLILAVALAATLSGCAHTVDWIQSGPQFPQTDASRIEVFSRKEDTKRPWGVIGLIHSPYVPVSKRGNLSSYRENARVQAAQHGADAVILFERVRGGDITKKTEPEVNLWGYAIKYTDTLNEQNSPQAR